MAKYQYANASESIPVSLHISCFAKLMEYAVIAATKSGVTVC